MKGKEGGGVMDEEGKGREERSKLLLAWEVEKGHSKEEEDVPNTGKKKKVKPICVKRINEYPITGRKIKNQTKNP